MLTRPRYIKSPSVRMLERLELEAYRREHPTIPESAVVPTKHRDDTANGLTRCIIRYLQFKGHQAERINTMGRPIDTRRTYNVAGCLRQVGSLRWGKSTSTAGSADISAVVFGRAVKVEVKIGADRQREAQRCYQSAVERAGGLYFIAKDFNTFVEWLDDAFKDEMTYGESRNY